MRQPFLFCIWLSQETFFALHLAQSGKITIFAPRCVQYRANRLLTNLRLMLGIIINPKSGKRRYRRQRLYLFKLLKHRHQPFTYKVTKYAGHATELAREFAEKGYDELLVLGGDGTLSEAVDGVMHANISDEKRREIALGLMPRGTGNDWGRFWGLTRDYRRSLDIFFNTGKKHPIDIGCLTLWRNGEAEKHYFINSVGFGVDAKTCQRAQVMKYYVGSHGLNYLLGLLSAVFTHKSIPVELSTDEGLKINEPMFTMNIGNGPYSGGGIRQNPDADPCDGVFHSMFVSRPTVKLILSAIPKLFNGRLKEISFIQNFTAREITLATNKHVMFEKDGILVDACGPYKIEIIHHAIQFLA